jgi:hypothetical protein
MAVVFLEKGLSPIPMRMASTRLHREPQRRVCQFALPNSRTYTSTKRNSLLNLNFLKIWRHRATEISSKTTIKK